MPTPPLRRARNPVRQLLVVNDVQPPWPFALRATVCIAVPVLIGWAADDFAAGLIATIGAFTSLYGSGRPYLNRGAHLGVIAVCFSLAVALGDWAAEVAWVGVLTVSVIAIAAVLVCNALAVGPPGAYMFVLACAAGTGVASEHLSPWRVGLLGVRWRCVRLASAHVRIVDRCPSARKGRGGGCRAGGCPIRRRGRFLQRGLCAAQRGDRVASVVERAGHFPAGQPKTEQHAAPATGPQP